ASHHPPRSTTPPFHHRRGGILHNASSVVPFPPPIPPRTAPGAGQVLPPPPTGLLLACSPRMERGPLGLYPELRTPQLPTKHVEAETGHHALARVLHRRHQPTLQQRLLLARMPPHV